MGFDPDCADISHRRTDKQYVIIRHRDLNPNIIRIIALKEDVMAAGEAVHIEVSDNGPGVPAEIRGRLFHPFVTAGKKNGLGLGLALARQTMLDHGGDLELVDSEKGARFRLRLPVAG